MRLSATPSTLKLLISYIHAQQYIHQHLTFYSSQNYRCFSCNQPCNYCRMLEHSYTLPRLLISLPKQPLQYFSLSLSNKQLAVNNSSALCYSVKVPRFLEWLCNKMNCDSQLDQLMQQRPPIKPHLSMREVDGKGAGVSKVWSNYKPNKFN